MGNVQNTPKPLNSKGAAIFKRILADKKAVRKHLKNGEKLVDFKRDRSPL